MSKIITKPKVGIVYTDAHSPEQDKASCAIVREVVKDLQPNFIVNMGDGASFESINGWNKGKPRLREGKRLQDDLTGMYGLDAYLTEFAPKSCKKIRHIGNHENWVQFYINEHPELEGLGELDLKQTYKSMGWKVIPWGDFSHIGLLYFHHGDRKGYQTKYHAAQWALSGKSICYGHRHDFQRFTNELLGGDDSFTPNAGFSIGCLGKRTPEWMDNKRNNWSNGFGVFYTRPGGYFNLYMVDIIHGVAMWNEKTYDGR